MISIQVDTHTHTIFSGHAFSTIEENAIHAKEAGMQAIAMTDHFGPWFADMKQFGAAMNMEALPPVIHDVRILAGTEIDIVDMEGHLAGYNTFHEFSPTLSVCDALLDTRDVAIASVHFFEGFRDATPVQATDLYCNVLRNPKVHIIGHCGRSEMPFDIDEVAKTAAQTGTCIEINEHSFDSGEPVISRCRDIALACAKHGAHITVGSDAHSAFFVGKFDRALQMLEEIDFPETLVANTTLARWMQYIGKSC